MASRSRSSSSKSSNDSAKRAEAARAAAAQTSTTAEENEASETPAETTPEVRLLGSLQPIPSREERIAISAYWRAAQRQFAPGNELDDWLAAEREVDSDETGRSESR
jgi:hypothetical protein